MSSSNASSSRHFYSDPDAQDDSQADLLQRLNLKAAQDEVPDIEAEEENVKERLADFRTQAAQHGMGKTPIGLLSQIAPDAPRWSGTSTPVVDDGMFKLFPQSYLKLMAYYRWIGMVRSVLLKQNFITLPLILHKQARILSHG